MENFKDTINLAIIYFVFFIAGVCPIILGGIKFLSKRYNINPQVGKNYLNKLSKISRIFIFTLSLNLDEDNFEHYNLSEIITHVLMIGISTIVNFLILFSFYDTFFRDQNIVSLVEGMIYSLFTIIIYVWVFRFLLRFYQDNKNH